MLMPYTNFKDWMGMLRYEGESSTYFEYCCSHKSNIKRKKQNKSNNKKHKRK